MVDLVDINRSAPQAKAVLPGDIRRDLKKAEKLADTFQALARAGKTPDLGAVEKSRALAKGIEGRLEDWAFRVVAVRPVDTDADVDRRIEKVGKGLETTEAVLARLRGAQKALTS
jgi:hypothetical protein